MRLWLLTPVERWQPWYDTVEALVVRAESEQRARELAEVVAGDESRGGRQVWLRAERTRCVPLEHDGGEGVVVRAFDAA